MVNFTDNALVLFIYKLVVLVTTFTCSVIIFFKIEKIKFTLQKCLLICSTILISSILCQLLGGYDSVLVKFLYIFLMCISLVLLNKKSQYSKVPISIIAVAIAFCIEYISVFITALITYTIQYKENNLITTCVSCSIQILLSILLSSNRIMQRISTYFENENHFGMGLLISSNIISISILLTQSDSISTPYGIILILCAPLILVGLILWIRSIVQRYRKNKLKDRFDAYTQQKITEKDEKIDRLETEVTMLAKQLHRDNHLLASLDRSVQKLSKSQSQEYQEQIIREIHTLYQDRNDLMTEEQLANNILPSTGIALIDSSLSDMYIKAAAHNISLDIIVKEELHYLVNNIISQTDLQTLLCDHLKDAIIAIDTAKIDNGKILMSIEKNEGIFEISIRDNGISFEPNTLSKLGKERVTTHSDEGGSGIGFMTTFETLAKSKGSLAITEYKNDTPFSKSITFIFDGLNRFIISSYRKEELKSVMTRDDIILI